MASTKKCTDMPITVGLPFEQLAGQQCPFAEKHMDDELCFLSSRDIATNLPNTSCLEYTLRQSSLYECLLVIDIVKLKKINKIYGRDSGDALLNQIRDFIVDMQIPHSSLYRINTGDFGLLIADTGGEADLPLRIAAQIHERLQQEWLIPNGDKLQSIFAAANFCIMPLQEHYYTSFADLLSTIEYTRDIAYNTSGIAVFNDALANDYKHKKALEDGLKKAVRQGMQGFYLLYQPIFEPGVGKWSGIEALCRWDTEEYGSISPEKFIPIAESCGLINEIGLWTLEQAIIQAKQFKLDQVDRFLLDVNLSPLQFETPNFEQIVAELLQKHCYPPEKLCLEVTEAGHISFSEYTMEAVHYLCGLGVLLALDNFGTGFSTLELLHKLPVKLLKTDNSFLTDLDDDPKKQGLFRVIIELAHNTDMHVIAKGVETDAQAKFLLKQGADYLQGFRLSRPLTPKQLSHKLQNFSSPSADLVSMGFGKIDISAPQNTPQYELNPSQYRMLYDCIHEVFANDDHQQAIESALARMGRALRVSRAYMFLKENDGTYSNTHEWCGPGFHLEKERLQHLPMERLYPQWSKKLRQDGLLLFSNIHKIQDRLSKELARQGVKSILVFPVWRGAELYGFVGLDDCEKERIWTPEEVQMLHTLTGIITSSLAKMWLQENMETQNMRREIVLNSLDIAIHVTDLETSEILFANLGLMRMYKNQHVTGVKCWKALEDRDDPCPFCPRNSLLQNPGSIQRWDHYCEHIGRHLRIWGSVIPWTDNKMVHLEYAEDITELKNSQEKLEQLASTDMLTLALNRPAFLKALQHILDAASNNDIPVTLVFIDIDGLKHVNDTYGHAAGDDLICSVAKALRNNIRESDALGRFGGDEFVIAFNHCIEEYAERRILSVLSALDKITGNSELKYSFSYGLAATHEVSCDNLEEYANNLIDLADKRMFEQKKHKRGCSRRDDSSSG